MEEKENKFIEFTKDEEAIHVNFLKKGTQIADILLGVAATIKIVMDETGKDQLEIFKIVSEMIDESEKNKKDEKGE